jgi:hypothetical protein
MHGHQAHFPYISRILMNRVPLDPLALAHTESRLLCLTLSILFISLQSLHLGLHYFDSFLSSL